MSEGERSSRKIKVVDRRWFTEEGVPRGDRPSSRSDAAESKASEPETRRASVETKPGPSGSDPSSQTVRQQAPKVAADPSGQSESSPLFLELVATLAQQAEVMLVGAPGFPKQPDQAQRLIDYLAILETKTRGNLSSEEAQILSNVLFQLRAGFVQAPKE